MTPDYLYEALRNQWEYPETETVINDEDMPDELKPEER